MAIQSKVAMIENHLVLKSMTVKSIIRGQNKTSIQWNQVAKCAKDSEQILQTYLSWQFQVFR